MSPPLLLLLLLLPLLPISESSCPNTPCTGLASYMTTGGDTLTNIGKLFGISALADIKSQFPAYNPGLTNIDYIPSDSAVNVPFECGCIGDGAFPARVFHYVVNSGQTYKKVASSIYRNLTTADWLIRRNSYPENNIPDGASINVTVNCSCGDPGVSMDYGLFVTYPLRPGQTVQSVAKELGFPSVELLQKYNEGANFSAGRGIVFVPVKDVNGSYHPLLSTSSKEGLSVGSIAGISVAAAVVLVVFLSLFLIYRRRQIKDKYLFDPLASGSGSHQDVTLSTQHGETTHMHAITLEKSVEFSYEELGAATDDFSIANKIGEGGFGAVYLAELRGEKTAVKKMAMQSTKEFSAELNVLTRVHHLNLVRLVGYCIKGSLFLVYEYMENGNLTQHLRSSAWAPLSWASRVKIALDSARGLEYIHEHTVPVYIHRDIKSANILLDSNFNAKVADFGLAKLSEFGGQSKGTYTGTRIVGTFGYMPPEYAQYGELSPKVDVYAFGVVLYELISAKEAVIKTSAGVAETKGLVSTFDAVFSQTNPQEELRKVIDPRLGEDYPLDSVWKMAELARACTNEDPHVRPKMKNVVLGLMALSSKTGEWDIGQLYDRNEFTHLMSGR